MDWSPLIISLKTAFVAILFTFVLGSFLSWKVMCFRASRVRIIIDSIITLPLVLPPTVAGFFLLYIFGVKRPLGRLFIELFNIKIAFSWCATVIAAILISFPLMYRSARAAYEQVDEDLLDAGRTIGMSEWKIFTQVLFPNAIPGIVSGGILAFARGLGEYGATAMIAGNIAGVTRTLPLAIYSEVAGGNMINAWNYVIVLLIIAFLSMLLLNITGRLSNRKR